MAGGLVLAGVLGGLGMLVLTPDSTPLGGPLRSGGGGSAASGPAQTPGRPEPARPRANDSAPPPAVDEGPARRPQPDLADEAPPAATRGGVEPRAREEGPSSLRIRCVDPEGHALAGVRIEARRASGAPLEPQITNASGEVRLSGLPRGEAIHGRAYHAWVHGGVAFGPARVGEEVAVVQLTPAEMGRLSGRIVDDRGLPVSEVVLNLVDPEQGEGTAVLDAVALGLAPDGSFLTTLAAGRYAVSAGGPGLTESDRTYVTVEPDREAGPIELVVSRAATISGRLELPPELAAALPLALDLVMEVTSGTEENPYTRVDRRPLQLDASHGFFAGDCAPGAYRIRLELPEAGANRVGPWVPFSLAPGEQKTGLLLALAEMPVAIQGRVLDDQGMPVAGAVVAVNARRVESDAEGRYALRGLDLGDTAITAKKEGYAPAYQPVSYDGARRDVDLVLQRCGGIRGAVEGPDGRPAAGVPVLAISRGDDDTYQPHDARADGNGGYLFEGLPPGIYYLKAGAGADPFDVTGAPSVQVLPGQVVDAAALRLQ